MSERVYELYQRHARNLWKCKKQVKGLYCTSKGNCFRHQLLDLIIKCLWENKFNKGIS